MEALIDPLTNTEEEVEQEVLVEATLGEQYGIPYAINYNDDSDVFAPVDGIVLPTEESGLSIGETILPTSLTSTTVEENMEEICIKRKRKFEDDGILQSENNMKEGKFVNCFCIDCIIHRSASESHLNKTTPFIRWDCFVQMGR